MFDVSIIIFFLALIGIVWMFASQAKRLRREDRLHDAFPSKDLSYENFKLLNEKARKLWLEFIHSTAIVLSKFWARLTHHIGTWFHKGIRRVEQQMIKQEQKDGNGEVKQSIFLTTIKTYKKEIKKLKGAVEEELPRPRIAEESTPSVDNTTDMNTIDESKLPAQADKPE